MVLKIVSQLRDGMGDFPYLSYHCPICPVNSTQLTTLKKEWFNKRKEAIIYIYIPNSLVNSQDVFFESYYCFTINQ